MLFYNVFLDFTHLLDRVAESLTETELEIRQIEKDVVELGDELPESSTGNMLEHELETFLLLTCYNYVFMSLPEQKFYLLIRF